MALMMRVWGIMKNEDPEKLFSLGGITDPAEKQQTIAQKMSQLQTDIAQRAWLEGPKLDVDATVEVDFGAAIHESENHEWLIRTTRFLHNELLPIAYTNSPSDCVFTYIPVGNPDNSSNGLNDYINGFLNDKLGEDWVEYNARPYERAQMLGLLNLYDFTTDPNIRQVAANVLNFMAIKHGAESMDNKRVAPFRRLAKDDSDKLYYGTDSMYTVWVGGLPEPVFLPGSGGNNVSGEMTLAASSTYRPPDWVKDMMLNPAHRNYLEYFNGQGQREGVYGGPDFVITGGGHPTDCPDPVTIFGFCGPTSKGNNPGTVEPIVLIPHRLRTPADSAPPSTRTTDYPSYNDEIYIPAPGGKFSNNCIYKNFACGLAGVSIPADLKTSPCTISNGPEVAIRIDQHCRGDSYSGDCIFVYTNLNYFVTHSCSPAASETDTDRAFHAFITYMQTVGRASADALDVHLTLPPPDIVDLTGVTTGEVVDAKAQIDLTFTFPWVINRQSPDGVMQGSLALTGGQYPTTSSALSSTLGDGSYFQQPVPLVLTITAAGGRTGMTGTVTFLDGAQVLGSAPVTATATGGQASLTVNSLSVGTHDITAVYNGDDTFVASTADIVHTVLQAPTKLSYTGDRTGDYNDPATVAAILTNAVTNAPVSGAPIDLTFDGQKLCSQPTDTAGETSCPVSPNEPAGTYPVTATFAGDTNYQPSRAEEQFTVTPEETTLSYTGPTVLAANGATLKTALKEDGVTPINGRSVTITVSDSTASQSCTGTTDTSGNASCTISPITVALGNDTITASFAGDPFYRPSNDTVKAIVFAFLNSGSFVLGNKPASGQVDFWGNQWAKTNGLSTGPAPDAFKGFAATTSEPPACSAPWSTDPGHSSLPPSKDRSS